MKNYREFIKINENISKGAIIVNMYDLEDGKLPVQYTEITGDFDCSKLKLTSLENCPSVIKGSLFLNENELTNLENFPKDIRASIFLNMNKLTSLEGLPGTCQANLGISHNNLTSLKGICKNIGANLNIGHNPLTSLEHFPITVYAEVFIEDADENITLQKDFVLSPYYDGRYYEGESYFNRLLEYIRKEKEDADIAKINWPDYIIKQYPDLLKSAKGINKFDL